MKGLFTPILIFLGLSIHSQTSVIFHRSHAGNMNLFKPAEIADNLGWTGTERQPFVDTSLHLILAGDTVSQTPYCNNPNIEKDSLNKKYPLYGTIPVAAVQTDSTAALPAANDTLAKPKERIKSRNELQHNEVMPVVDFYGNPKNPKSPGSGFLVALTLIMCLTGTLIWYFNRKKIRTA